jgi:hypothetical protein
MRKSGYSHTCRLITLGTAGMMAAMSSLAPPATGALKPAVNEFQGPSWAHLPSPSAYNKPPHCALTVEVPQCTIPVASQPPQDPNNPERYLNSAYWPAEERPDIEMYAIQRYGYSYKHCSSWLPHYCFLVDAEAVGYPVSHHPLVGNLWLAPCTALKWVNGGTASGCGTSPEWFLGYVQKVFPDGSFIESWGGSDTPADTGLFLSWFAGSMDAQTEFIHLMPPGSRRPA